MEKVKNVFNLIGYTALGVMIINLLPTFIKTGFDGLLDNKFKAFSLLLSTVVTVSFGIIKITDLYHITKDTHEKRRLENEILKHRLSELKGEDALFEFTQKIKKGEVPDYELQHIGFTEEEIKKLKE